MNRRRFLRTSLGIGAGLTAHAAWATTHSGAAPEYLLDATAITEVFGDGMKLTAVAVRYNRDIDAATVSPAAYTVDNRTVTSAYANDEPSVTATARSGRYVIVELSPDDAAATLWGTPQGGGRSGSASATSASGGPPAAGRAGPAPTITPAVASVTQVGTVTAVDGTVIPANPRTVHTEGAVNPIVDDFQQLTFNDARTGNTLAYNLFIPRGYDPARRYPLVLFMHDASVVGAPPTGPLVQGLGAVSWASPQDQSRHECFVVAPQYPTVVIDDTYQPTALFDTTVNLIEDLTNQYSIDAGRRYATGQSMGAMMTLGMNVKHPDLFAASYVVAGQWPTDQTGPLSDEKLWITVSQGDDKAYPAQNEITALAERNGATVTRAVWDGQSSPEEFANLTGAVIAHATTINYVAFQEGTTVPAGAASTGGGSEHMGTWHIAYGIPGIRDWIMQQYR